MKNEVKESVFDFESLLVRKEVFETLDTGDREHPILIYNPNPEQRKTILKMILDNLDVKEEGISANISGYDMIFKLLDELTNVKLGLDINNPEHQERVMNIVNDPSDIFLSINNLLNKIVNKIFYRYYDQLKELSEMPQDLREAYINSINEKDNINKVEISEKEKRRLELEEELKKLNEEGV